MVQVVLHVGQSTAAEKLGSGTEKSSAVQRLEGKMAAEGFLSEFAETEGALTSTALGPGEKIVSTAVPVI